MPGRTLNRWVRIYADGRDLSGYTRSIGPLVANMAPVDVTAPMADAAQGFLPGIPAFSPGVINSVMDNTATTGLPAVMGTAGVGRNILAAIGDRAAPVIGNPCYCGPFLQETFEAVDSSGAVVVNMAFGDFDEVLSAGWIYKQVWGNLLHPMGAETGANAANTNIDGGGQTTKGGILVYHITSIAGGAGTATISMDDSATGSGAWAACAGATTSAIGFASAPTSGFIAMATTATIRQYTRWQLTLAGGATNAVFASALIRGV